MFGIQEISQQWPPNILSRIVQFNDAAVQGRAQFSPEHGVGMFGVGPFSRSQKLILTIGTSILTVLALIRCVTFVATGNSEWPWTAGAVLVGAVMLIWIRRVPIKEEGR